MSELDPDQIGPKTKFLCFQDPEVTINIFHIYFSKNLGLTVDSAKGLNQDPEYMNLIRTLFKKLIYRYLRGETRHLAPVVDDAKA
jgi:hypothetical protein